MHSFASCCVCGIALLVAAHAGWAQWQPDKRVEIIASVAKGGGTDATARLVQKMLAGLRPSISVEVINRPGNGGAEAWAYLGGFEGSGRHLAISTPQLLTNHIMRADPHTYSHFTPLTNLYNEYVLLAVPAGSPIKSGRDLAARLRQDPSSVSVATAPALGSHNHIAAALVARAAGADPGKLRVHILRTGAEVTLAVLEGKADVVSATAGTLLEHVRSGHLRAVGLTAPMRLGGPLATVPTLREQGLEVILPSWRGVVGPAGMGPAQIAYWEHAFLELSLSHDWLVEITGRAWGGAYLDSNETREFLKSQYGLFSSALADIGLPR